VAAQSAPPAPPAAVAEASPAPASKPSAAKASTKSRVAMADEADDAMGSTGGGVLYGFAPTGGDAGGATASTTSAPKAEKKKDAAPAKEPARAEAPREEEQAEGMAKLGSADGDQPADREMTAERRDRGAAAQPVADKYAHLDFGAVTYLSNDDSMSLASAQRLLWAVQKRGPVKTSEVRPHEFLNYFSFDTADVQRGDTFSVRASAEEIGDGKLTMAFAVKGATPPRQPLDLTIVLDRSGSMSAEGRMDYLKRGLDKMTGQLQRGDRVDVVLFDDKICTPLEDYVVGRDDPSLLTSVISQLQPRGSTDLDAGLREGYRIANARPDDDDRNRRMLLISDALLNTGEIDPDVVSEVGKAYDKAGIRLSAVGVGREFNDKVLDMLSEKGKGAYVYLGSEAVVDRIFGPGFDSLTQTIAHDVHFALDLPDSLAIERFYGEESSTVKADVQPIDYYAGTTQLFLQDLAMRDGRPVTGDPVTLTVEWTDPASGKARTQTFRSTVGKLLAADSRNLHKGQALMAWTDLILERSLGGSPCGAPYQAWEERVQDLGEDAEIAWLDGLTAPLCGQSPASTKVVARRGVPYKVKVDSDQVIAEVGIACGRDRDSASLSGNVARFEATPGACQLVLYGNVPMYASVDVPAEGGDVRCVVRGGRISCS
ncbi:MAG: VWA domain-containing protein, partial [Deltaproteobacteria bacterium]|nr:VWA domain-containing protein [Deltaproteobacteria bacterium]